jgi:hypothetical protein
MKNKRLDNILDECLERILVDGETVAQCLERYPEYAAELEPLLQTAMMANQAVDIQPSPEFKARARFQLRTEMARADEKSRRSIFARQPRWAVVVVTVLVVVLLGGGTVLAAGSDNTIPGNPLYAVKLATENVQLALATSDAAKADVYTTMVDSRVMEIERLMERGKTELAERTLARLKSYLANISRLSLSSQPVIASEIDEVDLAEEPTVKPEVSVQAAVATVQAAERVRLQVLWGRYIVNHPDEIRALLEEAAPAVKPVLTRAIVASVNSYVTSYQNAVQEIRKSQAKEESGISDEEPDNSNREPGNTGTQPGTSDQQSGNSNTQPGNSSLTPDASNLQSSTVR